MIYGSDESQLRSIFENNTDLPINKWLHYFDIYEKYLRSYVGQKVVLLEIGTGQGGSSRMWRKYLGDKARVVTIDIRPECKEFETDGVSVRIGSQSDTGFLQSVIDEFGAPDIVIDDGIHVMDYVNASFHYLFPRMAEHGVYLVEDLHTAYWPSFGGGLRKPGTFIENMKAAVDEMHAFNPHNANMDAGEMPQSSIAPMIRGVSFHPSVVVVEKGPFQEREERSMPFKPGTTIW